MTYTLPFKEGDKLIELGGGDRPMIRPNADVRQSPFTDVVWDFNQPSSLATAQFDGLFCRYALEHVSWRRVRQFISECHRILKPGGVAVFITANLYEQCKKAAESDDWDDKIVCMLLGDNDYAENTHRSGWSPKSAERMFREQGFYSVRVFPNEQAVTDMIIEARKSAAEVTVGPL